jgi:hypothetical protein
MLRFGVTRLRLAALAVLAAVAVGGGSQPVGVSSSAGAGVPPRTVEATTLVASLRLDLAPAFDPGLRLVAIVASDIDDDGDLDVVANDGSLDLLVWINDGTGHLTRRYPRHSSGWRTDASSANRDAGHATVSAVTSAGPFFGPGEPLALSPSDDGEPRATYARPDLDSLFARLQGPRAPPLAHLSI